MEEVGVVGPETWPAMLNALAHGGENALEDSMDITVRESLC